MRFPPFRIPVFVLVLALVFILAACTASNGSLPKDLVMGGVSSSLQLQLNPYTAWKITPVDDWLQVTPSQGVGSQIVQIRANLEKLILQQGERNEYQGQLEVSGDVQGLITVRLPLVKVTGQVVENPPAARAVLETPALRQQVKQPVVQEILVKYRQDLRSTLLPMGAKVMAYDEMSRVTKLRASDPEATLQRLWLDPSVEWAELNGFVSAQASEPTDQFYPRQWHLRTTGAKFNYLQDYPNPVTVAVIDTGVRYDHPDLAGRLVLPAEGAYDFVDNDTDPTDPGDNFNPNGGSHGTHVTGLIVANSGTFPAPCPDCSTSGVVGTAYNAPVKVLPLRVLDQDGNGTFENVALAIRYAAGLAVSVGGQTLQNPNPVQIISLSLGSTSFSSAMCDAVDAAVKQGVLVVAAAGNYQNNPSLAGKPVYPGACPGAISVGATDFLNRVTYYSQQNSSVVIVAPGGDNQQDANQDGFPDGILSTTWNYQTNLPNYTYIAGTSQATPQVAAALALIISSGKATGVAAFDLLKSKAIDLGTPGRDDAYGNGLISLPAVFGWTLPPGGYAINLLGPISRQIPVVGNTFETMLVAGQYTLTLCRDDSGNILCEKGEPQISRMVSIPAVPSFDLGLLSLNP